MQQVAATLLVNAGGRNKMIVTRIQQQVKHPERYSVFIDGKFEFGLVMTDILYFKLKENEEISKETYDFIVSNLVYIKAQDTAINYIGYKARTAHEVTLKLIEKEYADQIIERVLEFLKKYDYVNDKKYCDAYIRESIRLKPKGRFLLRMELKQRGVDESIIEETLNGSDIDEFEGAERLLRKKIKNFSDLDEKERRRGISFLQRKGYSYDVIKEVFQICEQED